MIIVLNASQSYQQLFSQIFKVYVRKLCGMLAEVEILTCIKI